MENWERFKYLGKSRPGPGCRVIGIPGSASYAGKRGVIISRHEAHNSMVWVKWDDPGLVVESVVISLLEDEPVLDQLSRIE